MTKRQAAVATRKPITEQPRIPLPARIGKTERDIIGLGITLAALVMFVGTGGQVLPSLLKASAGIGLGPDRLLKTALLLNIALIVFGWRRYTEMRGQMLERCKAEEKARLLAETDPLTGCLNRRAINPATDRFIAAAHARGEAVGVLVIDIDHFKQVNDLNGHSAGDAVLLECTQRVRAILPPSSLLARLGGDEFACVAAFNPAHPEQVDDLAERIIARVSQPIDSYGYSGRVTVSLGLARSDSLERLAGMAPPEPITSDAMLHRADIAMYQAKRGGRNRHAWFAAVMESDLRYRGELEAAIGAGIEHGEFVPYYEQQIDLSTGELCGFEMLARWNSPRFGMVGPEIFIPIAEETGNIAELSERLITQALRDAREWPAHLTLSVNISPLQLRDPWFAQRLLKMLVTEGFPPSRLDIEITENCLHENINAVHALITSLRNQGIGISLDDFGTGYSSLAQLRMLPFNRIKIDRSFVSSMRDSADSATIVRSITSLGEGLGLPITAEGIEDEDLLERLRLLGQMKGQGYLYGRPQPADAVRAMLARQPAVPETTPTRRQG